MSAPSAQEPRENALKAGVPSVYNHTATEARWQAAWRGRGADTAPTPNDHEPAFVFGGCLNASGRLDFSDVRRLAIADAYARAARARGRPVLLTLVFDCFDIAPAELADRRCSAVRSELERLGLSFDWDHTVASFRPDHRRQSQQLFLALLECDRIYRRGNHWFLRTSVYASESERALDLLSGWSEAAVRSQREAVGGVDGIEVDAVIVGGGILSVFTPHADSIARAAFVAVSPGHPDIDAFAVDANVAARVAVAQRARWDDNANGSKAVQAVATGLQASVPGATSLLPIVISAVFDDCFGEGAVLGIPERDESARLVAETLEQRPAGLIKLATANAKPRSSIRHKLRDAQVTSFSPAGVPVPLVSCASCGTMAVPCEQLSVEDRDAQDGAPQCPCPSCGGPAQLDANAIDPRFDRMWMWMSSCVPVEDRTAHTFAHASHQRWLPALQVIDEADAGSRLLDQRTMAKLLHDARQLPQEAREPFAGAVVSGRVRVDADAADPDALVKRVGADVLRLGVLSAAAPATSFAWNDEPIRRCQRFLAELWCYAEPRLRNWKAPDSGIDGSTRARRRLATWCRVGADKVAISVERLDLQRAAHNAILLLTRIEDFEERARATDGDLDEKDREAAVVALLVLLQVLAPFAPHITEELWSAAGCDELLAETRWP